MHLYGVIVVDKPEGLTSFDVVARARRRFHTRSVGHTGTLDPMATGVLPLCVAEATRIARFLSEEDKVYEAELRLGKATDTQDRTGSVVAEANVPPLSDGDLEASLDAFRGPIRQVPPMFSAIRMGGERLYDKARRGEVVEREARDVVIHRLEVTGRPASDLVRFRVHCSKGTYVRTLGHDIGEALGCHGHLTALRRIRAGDFRIGQAVTLEEMMGLSDQELAARMIGEREALASMAEIPVDGAMEKKMRDGLKMTVPDVPGATAMAEGEMAKVVSSLDLALVAVVQRQGDAVRYVRGLPRILGE